MSIKDNNEELSNDKEREHNHQSILKVVIDNKNFISLPSPHWNVRVDSESESIIFSVSHEGYDSVKSTKDIVLSESNSFTLKCSMFMDNKQVEIPYISQIICNMNDLITVLKIFNDVKFCKCYLENHRGNPCMLFTAPFIDVCTDCINRNKCNQIDEKIRNEDVCIGNKLTLKREENVNNNLLINRSKQDDVNRNSICIFCRKRFVDEKELLIHYKTHLPSDNTSVFTCAICNKRFDHVSAVLEHYKIFHNSVKFIQCNVCKKNYRTIELFQKHLLRDHLEGKFVCKDCHTNFANPLNLRKHHCKHLTESTAHICKICKKKYFTSSLLYQHQKEHLRSSFKCKYCDKYFDNKNDLQNHKVKCIKKKMHLKYVCNVCYKRFSCISQKLFHIKNMHPQASQ